MPTPIVPAQFGGILVPDEEAGMSTDEPEGQFVRAGYFGSQE
jgi:hypothetical protein